jgi:hypothetical protein
MAAMAAAQVITSGRALVARLQDTAEETQASTHQALDPITVQVVAAATRQRAAQEQQQTAAQAVRAAFPL